MQGGKPMSKLNDAIADRLLNEEAEILNQLTHAKRDAGTGAAPAVALESHSHIVHDEATEQQAFAALRLLLQATDDGDADTEVSMLTEEAFAEGTFTPDPAKQEGDHVENH
jgi:hypothetical protein